MSFGEWCRECHRHHREGRHLPEFEIAVEPDDDFYRKVRAYDAEEAAERWADTYDSEADYTIVGGSPKTVKVRDEDGKVTRFEVHGEAVPSYTAHEITEPSREVGAPKE